MVGFADLFAGIGGFHQAVTNLGGEVVFASEWDKHARVTYEANHGDSVLFSLGQFAGDITKVEPASIPDFQVLLGGFPCQPFSVAGKRRGFEDTRGTMFFAIEQILSVKRPVAFVLENVRGLLSHDGGATLRVLETVIDRLGYDLFFKVLKANDYGVPQNRPRLFLVGFDRSRVDSSGFVFPEPVPLVLSLSEILGGRVTTPGGLERTVGFTLRVGGRGPGVNDKRNWDSYIVDGVEKRLSLDEARQLQGFPEGFLFPVSETQAFKQLGNSVAVPVVEAVLKEVVKVLADNKIV